MTDVDLLPLAVRIVDAADDLEVGAVTASVLDAVPDGALRGALQQALRPMIADLIRTRRPAPRREAPRNAVPRADVARTPPRPVVVPASRASDVRSWYEQQIAIDLVVDRYDGADVVKRLADCTRTDLRFVIRDANDVASRANRAARRTERLLARMELRGAARVGDLDPEDLAAAMQDSADGRTGQVARGTCAVAAVAGGRS